MGLDRVRRRVRSSSPAGVNERGDTLPVAEDGRWGDNNDYCEKLQYISLIEA